MVETCFTPKEEEEEYTKRGENNAIIVFCMANSTYWLMIATGRANFYRQAISWAIFSGKTSTARNWNKKEEKKELNVPKYSQVYEDCILCG